MTPPDAQQSNTAPPSALLSLLCRVFAAEVDEALLAVLRRPEIERMLDDAAPGFSDYVAREWTEELAEEEAVEFCRLFVLPGGAHAQAGAWLPGDDPNRAATIDALQRRVCSTLKLTLPREIASLPNDHASPLLLVSAWLVDHDPGAATEFIEQAISPWADPFCDALGAKAESPLYRAAAAVLRAVAQSAAGAAEAS